MGPLVLVDTSVWIDFFRSGNSPEAWKLVEALEQDRVCCVSVVRAEILSGARNEKEYWNLKDYFSAFPVLSEPADFWDRVARARFHLARKGISIAIPDLCIAILAEEHPCVLLTRDQEFHRIAKVVRLKFHGH